MKKIEVAYKQVLKEVNNICTLVVVILMLCIAFCILSQSPELEVKSLIVVGIIIVFVVILMRLLICGKGNLSRGISKMFKNDSEERTFRQTFEEELQETGVIEYHKKVYCFSLIMTRTWFVLISANGSIIRRMEEIKSVTQKLQTSSSKFSIVIELHDGKVYVNQCHVLCDEVLEVINKRMRGNS